MHCHPNARRTPRGRADLFEAVDAGMIVTAACAAFGVSRHCYYRWLPRWRTQGRDGLVDHSSRPPVGTSTWPLTPCRLSLEQEARIVALRRRTGWGADRLGAWLGMHASTCHRVLDRIGGRTPHQRLRKKLAR